MEKVATSGKPTKAAVNFDQLHKRINWTIVAWMVGIHVIALLALPSFSIKNFVAMGFLYFLTGCLGITLCFHRLLTHRSYKVPKWLERILSTCGIIALQGSPALWVAHHRMHHAGSDTPRDPHNSRRGFWYSHMHWLLLQQEYFDDPAVVNKFSRDIMTDPYYRWLDVIPNQMLIQTAVGVALYAIGGWSMVGWGIFVRLVAVYHTTWLVNSASHMWGYKNYEVGDTATNNWVVALLTWGEGWHNNHHAYGEIAPAGHRWWEIDITMWIIRTFEALGIATDVKRLPKKTQSLKITSENSDVVVLQPPVEVL